MNWEDIIKPLQIPKKESDYSISGKDIEARTFPFALPLKTTAQRDSINKPQKGLMIFNIDTGRINVYTGNTWIEYLASTTSSSSSSSSSTSSTTST